jgi:thiopurine S-methyltransferase
MEHEFWHLRWQRGETGFHRPDTNPWLLAHAKELHLAPGAHVFVPLCGKSVDLAWLRAQDWRVTGNELSEVAVDTLFADHHARRHPLAGGLQAVDDDQGLRVLQGDFFAVTPATLGPVDACWDRAALIALPPDLRVRYARHLASLLPGGARLLLVTLDYPQEQMAGPPFCVTAAEVHRLFEADFTIRTLGSKDVLGEEPRWRDKGITRMHEHGWLLTRT